MKFFLTVFLLLAAPFAAAKSAVDIFNDNNVPANNQGSPDITTGPIVPNGKLVKLLRFGCVVIDSTGDGRDGIVAIQWGSNGSWQTVRACTRIFEFQGINRDFVGDGSKRFRVVRINNSATARQMAFWVEAVVRD